MSPERPPAVQRGKRADARRNEEAILDAAAAVFVHSGVDAPVRRIAAEAGVGIGTLYRHFPSQAELVAAVYRHQVEACAEAGPTLLATAPSPLDALRDWIGLFVDFLVTKHGLANVRQSDKAGSAALHTYFVARLEPVCQQLLDAAAASGQITSGTGSYELMRGIGNLCVGREDPRYDPRRLITLLLRGLVRTP